MESEPQEFVTKAKVQRERERGGGRYEVISR